MSETPNFFPPRLKPALVRLIQLGAPVLARWLFQFNLAISPDDLKRLRAVESNRLLLFPNHPTFHDPIVMFVLSGRLQSPCYFLAAHETFVNPSVMFSISGLLTPLEGLTRTQWFTDLFRRFLQSMGMYSVHRGRPDRSSVAATLELIQQPQSQLVIFPEGGCSFQNDTVMPFRAGGVQLALQGLNRFSKRSEAVPDLFAVPIAIKYQYTRNMEGVIQASLERLETALGIDPAGSSSYERLRTIGATVLERLEKEYHLQPGSEDPPWTDRVETLKQHVIRRLEKKLGLEPVDTYIRERVYRIQHSLRQQEAEMSGDVDLDAAPSSHTLAIEQATRRLLNFDAIYDGYVAKLPTQERFLDTLIRLEREVFDIDQPPPKGFRRAHIMVGEPINLKPYLQAFGQNRSATVKQITAEVQTAVQAQLDQFNQAAAARLPDDVAADVVPGAFSKESKR